MTDGTEPERDSFARLPAMVGQTIAGCLCLAVLTYFGFKLQLTLTTVSFVDLMLVFCMALFCGFWQASVTSLLAVACLDYFFTQPLFHFTMNNPEDWISLVTFEGAAIVISRLSAKELRSAREAALHRTAMEQLYEVSRNSLLLDLRQAPGKQLVLLIQRIFSLQAVALFDANLEREDHTGEWGDGQDEIAKTCYCQEGSADGSPKGMIARILPTAHGPAGALVIRGEVSSLVADALASLAAIAIDRYQSLEKEERAENAQKSEQLRAAVMDSLAHEFKTPLTSVQTASSGLLEFGGLNINQTELVTLIDQETARMNALCTRLLLTAKLEPGKMPFGCEEVNVTNLMDELIENCKHPGDIPRFRVCVEDPELTVCVDRGLLSMILTQYLDNARKYSTAGTPIEIGARKSYNEALFSVHNFGPTIPLDDRERIFDRFYRSRDHSSSVAGTGIGLSVVRKAATAHHGHVWVVSDPNEGTTFFLSIPIDGRNS